MTTKEKKSKYFMKMKIYKNLFLMKHNLKLYKSKEGKTIKLYTFCVKLSGELEKEKKKYKVSRWLRECLKCFSFECF